MNSLSLYASVPTKLTDKKYPCFCTYWQYSYASLILSFLKITRIPSIDVPSYGAIFSFATGAFISTIPTYFIFEDFGEITCLKLSVSGKTETSSE